MKVLLYFLLLGLALEHIIAVPLTRGNDSDLLEVENSNEEDLIDEEDNEEESESGSGSGSKRDNIEEDADDENSASKDTIAENSEGSEEETSEEVDNKEVESEEEKEDSKQDEMSKKTEVPSSESAADEEGNDENASAENGENEEAPEEEAEAENNDESGPPTDDNSDGGKRSTLNKRCCEQEGEEEHGHHHGHHEHEHEHHHHGHHHGFVHEWGEEEGGGHHGHQGHGHHEHDHHHEHEHEHEHGGHENIGHHGGYGGYGGYGDGGGGGGGCGGGCGGGWGGGGGGGGGWGRSNLPAPPIAFHCRDMVSTDGKKHTQRFCVPIGHYGGYGWPYFHGYPGTGLGQWGWGFPWIKSKINKGKEGKKETEKSEKDGKTNKKEQRDHISKKQTVHVGYGYASGDNYRLGYQSGGMGGLASTFTGQLGPSHPEEHFKKSFINKRHFGFGGPSGADAFGGHSTPYGHPVTHPGFTTMGFPGHALASTDVRNKVQRPRRSLYDEDESIPEELINEANKFEVEDPENEFAEYQYAGYNPEENSQENVENIQ